MEVSNVFLVTVSRRDGAGDSYYILALEDKRAREKAIAIDEKSYSSGDKPAPLEYCTVQFIARVHL